jgi:acetyltransferase-like isoleucine patch superfamily enzyme
MGLTMRQFSTHGSGELNRDKFRKLGNNVIFEPGVLVFHPDHITIGSNVYVGHQAVLKGYYKGEMIIGDDVWIGQQVFFHSAGGLFIGDRVGIGPGVRIITSFHREEGWSKPILQSALEYAPVKVGADCDIGAGSVILPGVTIGSGVQIGAGSVVTSDIPKNTVAVGVPARVIRERPE